MFTARNRSSHKETHVVSGTCSCSICQETLVKLIEDATDAKSAVEALARQLFSSEELQNSSVAGLQCNKDSEARPGLSPSRWSFLESIVLRKGFTAATRSSVRKKLGLVLKKARANKENKARANKENKARASKENKARANKENKARANKENKARANREKKAKCRGQEQRKL